MLAHSHKIILIMLISYFDHFIVFYQYPQNYQCINIIFLIDLGYFIIIIQNNYLK